MWLFQAGAAVLLIPADFPASLGDRSIGRRYCRGQGLGVGVATDVPQVTEGVKGMWLCLGSAAEGFGAVPRDGSSSPLGGRLRTCLHYSGPFVCTYLSCWKEGWALRKVPEELGKQCRL